MKLKKVLMGLILAVSTIVTTAVAGRAQSITPAPDGTGTIVTQDGNRFDIQGGQLSGDQLSLFQSFTRFNLDTNQVANFLANPNLQNILTRVIGGDPSVINGLIQVSGGNANLFLLNPAGIMFGPTASLNVPAAFTATTATGIGFGANWFTTTGPQSYSQLVGSPDRFAFPSNPGSIFNAAALAVSPGQNLSLLGGTIVSTGSLTAPGGQITIATVPGSSLVRVSQVGSPLSLDIQPLTSAPSNPNPLTLAQLLTGGGMTESATGVTVNANGQVVLNGSGLPINPGDVTVRQLQAGSALVTANQTLTLAESQLQTSGNLALLAQDTVRIRDSATTAFLAQVGGDLRIQGNQAIDILALNHLAIPAFQSQGKITLASNGLVSADAHFVSGQQFAIVDLAGNPLPFTSLFDPIISVDGDVTFGGYTGAALKIEATGSIVSFGDIVITSPDADLAAFCANSTVCSDDAQILARENALILRAGVPVLTEPGISYSSGSYSLDPITNPIVTVSSGNPPTTFSATDPIPPATIEIFGDITTSSPVGTSGRVILEATGGIFAGSITTSPIGDALDTAAGSVEITSSFGDIDTDLIQTSSILGQAGSVFLQADDGHIRTGPIWADSGTPDVVGASVGITAWNGSITTGDIDASVNNGTAGRIVLDALQDITVGSITAPSFGYTTGGSGGIVNITSWAGSILATDINTSAFDGGGGTVTLKADGDVIVDQIYTDAFSSSGFSSLGGDVNITAYTGSIQITGLSTSAQSADFGSSAGFVSLFAGTDIDVSWINTSASNFGSTSNVGSSVWGGNVTLDAGNAITVDYIGTNALIDLGDAQSGSVNLIAGNAITANLINADTIAENAGNALSGNIAIRSDDSITLGMASAAATVKNAGDAQAGSITIIAGNSITASDLITTAGDLIDGNLSDPLGIAAGANIGDAFGGDIYLEAGNSITVNSIVTAAGVATGNALSGYVTGSAAEEITLFDQILTAAFQGTPSETTVAIGGDVTLAVDNPSSALFSLRDQIETQGPTQDGIVRLLINGIEFQEDEAEFELPDLDFQPELITVQPELESAQTQTRTQTQKNSVASVVDNVTVSTPSTQNEGPIAAGLDKEFTADFEGYLGVEASRLPPVSLSASETLRQIQKVTGIKPAIVYARFVPVAFSTGTESAPASGKALLEKDSDQLELLVITADQEVRKRVAGVNRGQVLDMAQRFRAATSNPQNQDYLEPAQQLYQWLIAPIESTLQTEGTNNLAFIADMGLRSLPLGALHNGKQFLIEKYSLGLMPSLRLTDTRYVDLRKTQVLGMGASQFSDQTPLPAVPQELALITRDIWSGQAVLNQEFTIENLQRLRRQQRFGILHLATHGEFRPGAASNSYIQFWNSRLYLNQLRELGLNDPPVELLVLSACRTALGDRQAELGFAGLAVQAGVKSAIGSLWYVSDAATLGLMTEFYRMLKTAPIKSEALRQAQIAMLQGQIRVENGQLRGARGGIDLPPELRDLENKNLSHPYYWAGFTMIGSPW